MYAIENKLIIDNPFLNLKPYSDLCTPKTYTSDSDTIFSKDGEIKVCEEVGKDAIITHSAEPLGIPLSFKLAD